MHEALLLCAGVLVTATAPAVAFQRVHLTVGAGAGAGSWGIAIDGRSEPSDALSFTTDFEIGASVSKRLAIYYLQKTAWFNSEVTILPGEFGGPLTPQQVGRILTFGLSGVGATYRLSPGLGSVFLTGGIGLAWWSQVFEESTDCVKFPIAFPCADVSGVGVTAGAGYELSRRFALEMGAVWGDPSSDGTRFNVVSNSAAVTFGLQLTLF